ncbi:MAG: VacJ family lipoprotein, partial [Campylobacterota bacterium]
PLNIALIVYYYNSRKSDIRVGGKVHYFLLSILLTGTLLCAQEVTDSNSTFQNSTQEYASDSNATATESEEAGFTDDFEDEFAEEEFADDAFSDEFSEEEELFDPLSGYNRVMTGFNDGLYVYVLDPVLFRGYNYIPEPARVSVNNFFENLYFPVSVVNNILQLKVKNTATETLRFVINSTVGVLGLFDPARSWFGLEPHQEDFGQTLGHYGVGSGFHIVLPFFGPTNLRDLSGDFVDFYVNPIYYVDVRKYNVVNNMYQGWAVIGYKQFNKMSTNTKEYDNVRQDALELYPFIRDLYEQNRQKQIEE